jgi:hypothetical protein
VVPLTARAQVLPTETLEFAALADTYVDSDEADMNFGGSAALWIDGSPRRIALLRFAVAGVAGRRVLSARLRLAVTDKSDSGGRVHLVQDAGWREDTVTWDTRPALAAPVLASLGAVAAGTAVEFVLDGAIPGDGAYGLALESASADGAVYVGSESPTGQRPTLVLTVDAGPEPSLVIRQPAAGTTFYAGDVITLQGAASDLAEGDLSHAIVWSSHLDGFLGTGAVLRVRLRPGLHALTAAVFDRDHHSASAGMGLTVTAPPPGNAEPLVAIVAPLEGRVVTAGRILTFSGSADDLEDGDLGAALRWTSDLAGPLGTGTTLARALGEGTHRITATATDGGGLDGSAAITVHVVPAPGVTFTPVADAYVDAGESSANFGAADVLEADANTQRVGYLRFVVAGTGGQVVRAVLQLRVAGESGAESDSGGSLVVLSNPTWSEGAVTFRNRPPVNGPVPAGAARVGRGQAVEFDVSATVIRDGTYDFALVSASSDGVTYTSRESDTPPRLVLTLRGQAPTVTIGAPTAGQVVFAGVPVTLAASAIDLEDGNLGSRIGWRSSLDGPLGTGARLTVNTLRPGVHVLTASVTDSDGGTSADEVQLRVRSANTAPRVTILAPAADASSPAGTPLTLRATASDDFDGDLSARVEWSSSVSGPLGVGGTLAVTLREGVHLLSAAVADSDGIRVAVQTRLTITPTPPVVQITAPAAGATAVLGARVTLTATAIDATDGNLSAALRWTSDRDGALGVGGTISTTALSPGVHVLTASVTDRGGLVGSAQRLFLVQVRAGQFGFQDFSFGSGADQDDNRLTASKPESKLWYHDRAWWGTLYTPAGRGHRIHRLDVRTQQWIDTGVLVDERPGSRQDVLSEGDRLYVVSRGTSSGKRNRVLRYSYTPASGAYTLDAGFPVNIAGGGTEAMTIAKDSTGRLWVAYTLGKKVLVNRTVGDDTQWGSPFTVPVSQGTSVHADDIAGVEVLPGAIGVFWSNQRTDAFYFAVHDDTAAPTTGWRLEIPARGGKVADDHFNLKLAPDGRLFVAVKTSATSSSASLIGLLVRAPQGTWSPLHQVATVGVHSTRPTCLLDEVRRRIYVFYSPNESGIYYKSTDIDAIRFPSGIGTVFIDSNSTSDINNPTTTKQNVTPSTGIVVVASSPGGRSYWHNMLFPDLLP